MEKSKSHVNIDEKNIKLLEQVSLEWWDPKGVEMLLHSMNPVRVRFLIDGLINNGVIKAEDRHKSDVLKGISILDVGCGPGLLSEALAKLKANVTGLDPSEEFIRVAKNHIKGQSISVDYICEYIEDHSVKNSNKYDVVIASEVVEHVPDQKAFIHELTKCVKPNGSIIITTPNRTLISWMLVKILGEFVLNIIVRYSHKWSHFITPKEVEDILKETNCKTIRTRGSWYTPFINKFNIIPYTGIHYYLHAVKLDS